MTDWRSRQFAIRHKKTTKTKMESKWDEIYNLVSEGSYPPTSTRGQRQTLRKFASKFTIHAGHLFFGASPHRRAIKSREEAWSLFKEFHASPTGKHTGIVKTRISMCSRFFWPGMTSDIQKWVSECEQCQRFGPPMEVFQTLDCTKMHVSIFDLNTKIALEECNTCCNKLFHCPICPNFEPTVKERIEKHMSHHISHGLPYKDKILLRCSLQCRPQGHFHCPLCSRTVMRRLDMKKHLLICQGVIEGEPIPESCLEPASPPKDPLIELLSSPSLRPLLEAAPPSKKPHLHDAPPSKKTVPSEPELSVKPVLTEASPDSAFDPQPSTSKEEHSYSQSSSPDVTMAYGNAMKCPHCNNNIYLFMFNKPPSFKVNN
ncbi:PREDICTED: uncharacterized protein LOC107100149 [Cyprinodon variegatus]|uniref:uncharacterized protein LOC107100149 n=1 Tax=Cyprinodon variegatus TaxID=28743 RepID=UPI00074295BE|nr:PREDICTED: uncharacterized protein LOC107100149 [Cyprinodon variegatus]